MIVNRPQRGVIGDDLACFKDKEAAVDALDPAFGYRRTAISSPEELHARDLMRAVAEQSMADIEGAWRRARTEARDWLSEGEPTVAEGWFYPLIAAEGEAGALVAAETRYDLVADSLGSL